MGAFLKCFVRKKGRGVGKPLFSTHNFKNLLKGEQSERNLQSFVAIYGGGGVFTSKLSNRLRQTKFSLSNYKKPPFQTSLLYTVHTLKVHY